MAYILIMCILLGGFAVFCNTTGFGMNDAYKAKLNNERRKEKYSRATPYIVVPKGETPTIGQTVFSAIVYFLGTILLFALVVFMFYKLLGG